MNIDKVIFTCDDNNHYSGFWKSISKHYKLKLGITPHLFVISSKSEDILKYDTTYGIVSHKKIVSNIPGIIQALIGKFYFTIDEPETTWIIGDLDLYPLQKEYFFENIKNINEDKYVHLNAHAYGKNWRDTIYGLAGYYHVAKGKIFKKELDFNKSFEDVLNEIYTSNKYGIKFHNLPASIESMNATSNYGWFCCEEMYTGDKLKNSNNLIEISPPTNYSDYRLDRSNFIWDENKIKNKFYIDMHSPRPYEKYSEEIERILNYVT